MYNRILAKTAIDTYKHGFVTIIYGARRVGKTILLEQIRDHLNVSVKTVARYLDLLEKSFIIFHLNAYSRNPRREVAKSKKYHFYDLGIRNILTEQLLPLSSRTDVSELWENFLLVERMKQSEYAGKPVSRYFWRNYTGAEADLIEVGGDGIKAFEFKWNKDSSRTPKDFRELHQTEVTTINRDNYLDFIL